MAIIKCKMCGGDLNIIEGMSVAECEYCGSRQTIPAVDDEKKLVLFERAERLRRNCEFDKAAGVYESIVADFRTEAEAYWGLVLCRFGIEYVDDPATGKKVPTCHRSSFDSVMDDSNFELALENTDAVARRVYREEAKAIEELRKGIIEVSSSEEPYDIFINYKETDENGDRTLDSVIAQDIYDALCDKGYRVFFSRISLEDKLGTEYEPYIFAALNSAKLMISVGTDYEHFNAVWVKNEWSRFLQLIAKGEKKTLIPCYKNIDAYDMPKEFAKLSAQDMGKVGAMQDLLRGVEKILGTKRLAAEEKRETVIVQQSSGGPNVQALLKRGNMALEDKDWASAKDFFNRVLDMDAECSDAYLGLFLAAHKGANADAFVAEYLDKRKICSNADIAMCSRDKAREEKIVQENTLPFYTKVVSLRKELEFDTKFNSFAAERKRQLFDTKQLLATDSNFTRAMKFSSGETRQTVEKIERELLAGQQKYLDEAEAKETVKRNNRAAAYAAHLDRVEAEAKALYEKALARREEDYLSVCSMAKNAATESQCLEAAQMFSAEKLKNYKDCDQRAAECRQKAEELKAQRIAEEEAERKRIAAEKAEQQRLAREAEQQRRAKEAAEMAERKRRAEEEVESKRIADEKRKEEQRARNKKLAILAGAVAVIAVAVFIVMKTVVIPANEYKVAEALYAEEKYHEALAAFEALGGYKDAEAKVQEISEQLAKEQAEVEKAKAEAKAVAEKAEAELKAKAEAERLAKAEQLASTICAGSYHSVGLKSDGTVVAVGDNPYGQCDVDDWKDIVAISAGSSHTVGLKSDGTVVAMGDYKYGQCNVDTWSDIVAICGGATHTVGLKSDGTVVSIGSHKEGENKVSGWTDVIAISAGDCFSVGLRSNGKIVVAGKNKDGQLDAFRWTDIIAISAGHSHTVGLKSDGTVVAVGDNSDGQCDVDDWKDIVAISAGHSHTVGLKSDGTVVAVGRNSIGQCDVSGWTDIVAVSTGASNTFGLKSDGTVVAVGFNKNGQCNVSEWTDIKLPEA